MIFPPNLMFGGEKNNYNYNNNRLLAITTKSILGFVISRMNCIQKVYFNYHIGKYYVNGIAFVAYLGHVVVIMFQRYPKNISMTRSMIS